MPDRSGTQDSKALGVGVGGFGAIGRALGRRIDAGIPGLRLVAVSARDRARAERNMAGFTAPVPALTLEALARDCDIVVEALPAAAFDAVADAAVAAGRIFVPTSVGQMLRRDDLVAEAERTGSRILVPTGALLGLDVVRAAAEGEIREVRMVTRKPPNGLAGAPHLVANGIDLEGLEDPLKVFDGSARDGAKGFPTNVNVAAALGLAGIGPDRTRLEIWADPGVTRNCHKIIVDADSARFEMQIENVPTDENPKTGRITALSVLACLRGEVATMRVGS